MKEIMLVAVLILFSSCNSVDPWLTNSDLPRRTNPDDSRDKNNLTIQTEHTSYAVNDVLSVKTTFTNYLGKEISIINAGCGFPDFILEKYELNVWQGVGGPICIALYVPPTKLSDRNNYAATVSMFPESSIISGTYRMKFDIRDKEYGSLIELKYLYSNSFEIIKQ